MRNTFGDSTACKVEFTPASRRRFDALTAEQTKLESESEGADELPDEVDARLAEIEMALAAFENRPVRYEPDEIARAGVFVASTPTTACWLDRGYVRRGRSRPCKPARSAGGREPVRPAERHLPLPMCSVPSSTSRGRVGR